MLSPGYGFIIIMTAITAFLLAVSYGWIDPQTAPYAAVAVGILTAIVMIAIYPAIQTVVAGTVAAIVLILILLYAMGYIDPDYVFF
ncbi:MAG: hypothetical protein LBE48_02140 [Methanomassiliicoccaceae archaeon]|jgi:hypothetical protein|nr:hypothetical protein [Methanomassiliicoccaceae archaeon]